MRMLLAHRNVIDMDQLCDALDGGRSLPQRAALVTFDDATQDHYSRALPIMRRHSIPAVFFVSTRSLEERTVEWWNLLSFALRECAPGRHRVGPEFGDEIVVSDAASRTAAFAAASARIKLESPQADALPVIQELASRLGVTLPSMEQQSRGLINAAQLSEMREAGMTIGSHSHSHAFLRRLSAEAQLAELSRSKRILEGILGVRVRSLAYPYGQAADYDSQTCAAARDAGYDCAFNLRKRNVLSLKGIDRYDIDRFPVPGTSNYEFEASISGMAVQ
jgi:peptidoglycan/xylan/chitin deacetylase (PgdA/CDA1 family)